MECKHKITYFGVTNLIYKGRTIGAIDMWRCLICKKIFAEAKKLGVLDLAPEVGMPTIDDSERWGVLVCKLNDIKDRWELVKVKENDIITHKCLDQVIELQINNFNIDDNKHWLFKPEDYINKEVNID